MSIRLSSAMRSAIVTNYGLAMLLQGGHIQLYSGGQPASADADVSGTLLARITKDNLAVPTAGAPAGGLLMEGGTDVGTLIKRLNWTVQGLATGTFGWWRFAGLGSAMTGASTTAFRMDGAAADSFNPGEISAITAALVLPVSSFILTLPAN